MTGPSSNPSGEKPGRPGTTWETTIQPTGQQHADDDAPQPRATRRAARRRKDNR